MNLAISSELTFLSYSLFSIITDGWSLDDNIKSPACAVELVLTILKEGNCLDNSFSSIFSEIRPLCEEFKNLLESIVTVSLVLSIDFCRNENSEEILCWISLNILSKKESNSFGDLSLT